MYQKLYLVALLLLLYITLYGKIPCIIIPIYIQFRFWILAAQPSAQVQMSVRAPGFLRRVHCRVELKVSEVIRISDKEVPKDPQVVGHVGMGCKSHIENVGWFLAEANLSVPASQCDGREGNQKRSGRLSAGGTGTILLFQFVRGMEVGWYLPFLVHIGKLRLVFHIRKMHGKNGALWHGGLYE